MGETYTAIVAGILLLPWGVVGISIIGWLANRKRRPGPSAQGKSGPQPKLAARL